MISEAPETKLKEVLGLVWPITDSINTVDGPVGHFEPSSSARMCFKQYYWAKGLQVFFWLNFNYF